MVYVEKDNRQYSIAEDEKQKFIDAGYRVGKLEGNKLVFEEVETEESKQILELNEKIKAMEAELKKLGKDTLEFEEKVEDLTKERTTLRGQLTKSNNRIDELEKELEKSKGEGK